MIELASVITCPDCGGTIVFEILARVREHRFTSAHSRIGVPHEPSASH